jgi:type I restriction enzyme, S subunit
MSAVTLGEHAKLIRGITFKPTDKCDPQDEGAVVCMRTKNVQVILDTSDLIAIPSSLVKNPEKIISTGDILVSSANSWNLVGKCCQVRELQYPSTAGGFISILRPMTEQLNSSYLYRWFSSDRIQRRVRSFGNQTTNISNLDHKRTLKLPIPLPPLPEQKRIAAILDAADALRAKRRESLAQLDALLQSTFLEMFGDPVTNPMGWEVNRLENVFSKTRPGTCCGPFGSALKKHEYVEDGIPVWGIDNVQTNKFTEKESLFITPDKFSQLNRYSVEPGDILISRAGTVGRMCEAHPTMKDSIIGSNLIRLTLDHNAMLPVYFTCLYSFCGRQLPGLRASGDEKAYSFLNTTKLKSLQVPFPSIAVQHHFSTIVESIEQQKALQQAHLIELDTLFASLQHRAFNGEL